MQQFLKACGLLMLGFGLVYANPACAEEGPDPDKASQELWQEAFDTTVANPKDEAIPTLWNDYYQKYQREERAARALYMVGESLYQQGYYAKAASAYKTFLEKFPRLSFSDSAHYRLAECAYNQENYKAAILLWDELQQKYSRTFLRGEAMYGQILCHIVRKNWREAAATISRLTQAYPHYRTQSKIKLPLGLIYFHEGQYSQAMQYFQSIPGDMALYYVGRSLEEMGRFLPAAAAYKKISEQYPDSPYVLESAFNKADSYYKGANFSVAVKEFEGFLKRFPDSPYRDYTLYKLGVCYLKQEDYASALKNFSSVAQNPERSNLVSYALYMVGECNANLKKNEAALAAYNRVVSEYPNTYVSGSAKFKIGWIQLRSGNPKAALQTFREFITTYPIHENVQLATYLLGNAFFKDELYVQAVPIYQNILMKYKYSDVSDAALAAMEMAFYIPKQYEQLISSTHYILRVLTTNFPPSKSIWRSLAYFYLAEAYYHMKMWDEAAGQYKKNVENFSDSPILNWAKLGLAYSLFEAGQFKDSRRTAKDLAETEDAPQKLKNYGVLMQGHNLFMEKKYEEAIVNYEQFAGGNRGLAEAGDALFYAGQAYYQLEFYANAIDSWKQVITFFKSSEKAPEAAYKMGDTYFKAQRFEEAVAAYQLLSQWPEEKNPYRKSMLLHIAQCYYNAKLDDKAIAAYRQFVTTYPEDPKVKDAMEGIQLSFYRKGASADAVAQLMEFVQKFPNSRLAVDALYRVGEIYYQEKNLDQCIAAFQQLIADYPESSLLPNAQYYLAVCQEGKGDKRTALRSYQAFIKNFPTHELVMDVRFRLGSAFFGLSDYENAVEVFRTIVDLDSKSDYAPNALYNIALCYKSLKQWRKAVETYTEFYKLYPKDSKANDALMQIATTYREEKRYDSAIQIYKEMANNPAFTEQKGELLYSVADSYLQMEAKEDAANALEALRPLTPKNDVYRLTALAKLGSLYEELQKWAKAYEIYTDLASSGSKPEWVQAAQSRMTILKMEHAAEVEEFIKKNGGAAKSASPNEPGASGDKPNAKKKK
jgi:TolA-binding protein